MKLDELSVRDQKIDELSVGGVARGVGKAVGGVAKGVGALAGGVVGIGSALKKGYQAGKKTVGGDDAPAAQGGTAQPAQQGATAQGGTAQPAQQGAVGGSNRQPAAQGSSAQSAQQGAAGGQTSTQPAQQGAARGSADQSAASSLGGQETQQDVDMVTSLQNRIIKLDTAGQREVFKVLQAQAKKAPEGNQEQPPAADAASTAGQEQPAADQTQAASETPPEGATNQPKPDAATQAKIDAAPQGYDTETGKPNAPQDQKPTANFGQGGYGATTTNAPAGLTPQQPDPTKQPAKPTANFGQGGYGATTTNAPTGMTPPQPAPQTAQSAQAQTAEPAPQAAQQTAEPAAGGEGGQQAKKVDPKLRDKKTGRYTKDHTADDGWDRNVSQFGDSKINSKKSITESKKSFSLFRK
jgi:hypothetical protein